MIGDGDPAELVGFSEVAAERLSREVVPEDAIAAGILSRADSNNGKITDEDILCVFRQWTFRNTM